MTQQRTSIGELAKSYPGIEGFYFLNRQAQLGYVDRETLRATKETFPQIKDRSFLQQHPEFLDALTAFLADTEVILKRYLDTPDAGMELGYLDRCDPKNNQWQSASVVLRDDIVDVFKEHDEYLYKQGMKDPFKADPDEEKLQNQRSIQHGLDDLISHQTQFGVHLYFPVMFMRASAGGADTHPVRILNLLWRSQKDDGGPAFSNVDHDSQLEVSRNVVFDALRANLVERGAIDHSKRLEHRLSIA